MEFNLSDQQSSTWQKLKAHLETTLQGLREQNDQWQATQEQHAYACGRIAEIKRLLAIEQDFIERTERRSDGVHL